MFGNSLEAYPFKSIKEELLLLQDEINRLNNEFVTHAEDNLLATLDNDACKVFIVLEILIC